MDFWMLTAFTNREFLVFLHFPEVPRITFTRKFKKLGNNSVSTVYLGHGLASPWGIFVLFTFSEVRGGEGTQQLSESFKSPWRCLEYQEIPASSLQQILMKIWDMRTRCSPVWLRLNSKGLALERCHVSPPTPSWTLISSSASSVLEGSILQNRSCLFMVPLTIL